MTRRSADHLCAAPWVVFGLAGLLGYGNTDLVAPALGRLAPVSRRPRVP